MVRSKSRSENGVRGRNRSRSGSSRSSNRRALWQALAFILANSYFFKFLKYIPCPTLNCYACPAANFACPIGTLQHFAVIRRVPFFTLGILGAVGSIFGRGSCGWICPVGGLQDILYRLPVPAKKIHLPNGLGAKLSFLRYVVLAVLVFIIPFFTLEPWFSKLCFVGTLEAGIPLALGNQQIRALIGPFFWLKIVITAALLGLMLFMKRPFCRFICPLGAIYSPFNKVAPGFAITVRPDLCIECGECTRACPMDLDVPREVNGPNCIRCRECVGLCRALSP